MLHVITLIAEYEMIICSYLTLHVLFYVSRWFD